MKNKKNFILSGFCEEYITDIEKQRYGFRYYETNNRNDALEFYTEKAAYSYLKNLGMSKYKISEIKIQHDKIRKAKGEL